MPRINTTVTKETAKALREIEDASMSEHVRRALAEYLARHGKRVNVVVQHGGDRRSARRVKEPQSA